MATTETTETGLKKFFNNVVEKLKDLKSLEIRTIVGDLVYDKAKDSYSFPDGKPVDGMVSIIDLLEGDIDTKISKGFAREEYGPLREFHMIKENQGQEIVKKNMEVLQTIAQTIVNIGKANNKDENEEE